MKNYYTERQLADELGIGIQTVYEWRKSYGLEGIMIGREWAHSKDQIDRFFSKHRGKCVSKTKAKK